MGILVGEATIMDLHTDAPKDCLVELTTKNSFALLNQPLELDPDGRVEPSIEIRALGADPIPNND